MLLVGRTFGEPLAHVVARDAARVRAAHALHAAAFVAALATNAPGARKSLRADRQCCGVTTPVVVARLGAYLVRSGALADEGVFRIAGRKARRRRDDDGGLLT